MTFWPLFRHLPFKFNLGQPDCPVSRSLSTGEVDNRNTDTSPLFCNTKFPPAIRPLFPLREEFRSRLAFSNRKTVKCSFSLFFSASLSDWISKPKQRYSQVCYHFPTPLWLILRTLAAATVSRFCTSQRLPLFLQLKRRPRTHRSLNASDREFSLFHLPVATRGPSLQFPFPVLPTVRRVYLVLLS